MGQMIPAERVGGARADGAKLDHVVGIEIGQLEPVLRHIGGREKIVLGIFFLQGEQEIAPLKGGVHFRFDGAFDGQALGPLDNRGNDGAAGQVAAIEMVPLAAAIDDLQKLVLAGAGVMVLRQDAGQNFFRLGQRQGFLEVNLVNALRAGLVGTTHLDLPVNAARAQNGRINQVRPVGG